MKRSKALAILVGHNAWRRGANTDQLNPRDVGHAIDYAILVIKQLRNTKKKAKP